jgi:hypothetical protein
MPAVAVTLGDMVKIHFNGYPPKHPKHNRGFPLELRWNNRPYIVAEGADVYVPFDCAKSFFGDPRSVENVIRIKDDMGNDMIVADRAAEVIRLQQYWQNAAMSTNQAKFREYTPGDRSFLDDFGGKVSDLIPDVEVYSIDGQRIHMVADDPFGDNVVVSQQTRAEAERMRTQLIEQSDVIGELKKQNKILLAKLGLDPEFLNPSPEAPVRKQESALETPTDPVIEEAPKMVYNPRTRRIIPRRPLPHVDPTTIDELPTDTD